MKHNVGCQYSLDVMLGFHNSGMCQQPVARAVHTHTHTHSNPCYVCVLGQSVYKGGGKKSKLFMLTATVIRGERLGKESRRTVASSSNFPKSSFSSLTSSWAVHWEARLVKPTMSANRMLQQKERAQVSHPSKFYRTTTA